MSIKLSTKKCEQNLIPERYKIQLVTIQESHSLGTRGELYYSSKDVTGNNVVEKVDKESND